ncbi:MAG: hypothetical protein KDK45_00440 [Leptospiraceae bacterium]|nr:hypothetical protein [Leptospiraceae bacterium]
MIQSARENIILQMYLFSGNGELRTLQMIEKAYPWAHTVAKWLIEKKRQIPEIQIIVILDTQTIEKASLTPVKIPPLTRHRLESEGIIVLNASLRETLYNKNRKFPKICRFHETWDNNRPYTKSDWVSLQNRWQSLHNVEDHRKNLVIDSGKAGLIFSHNIIDQAYLWQENTFLLRGTMASELWNIALVSLKNALSLPILFSEEELQLKSLFTKETERKSQNYNSKNKILESGPVILKTVIKEIHNITESHITEIILASTYFSDLKTLEELLLVSKTVRLRILVDNCHALALKPFLRFLLRNTVNLSCIHTCRKNENVELRLFPSRPTEMMHCKAIAFLGKKASLIAGQANYTPNSFSGAWLETNVYTEDKKILNQFQKQFEELWNRSELILPYKKMKLLQSLRTKIHAYFFLFILRIFDWFGFRY